MKGGTTVLHESLCAHPRIDAGSQKEIHYFSLYPHESMEWYASHFRECKADLCVDASPTYFDFAQGVQIPKLIKNRVPDAKIILILRDPVARAVSHYFHMKKVVKPAWLERVEINDFFSTPFENACRQTSAIEWLLNQILWCSCYYRKYLSYRAVFEEKGILILTNEQLKHHPRETMKKSFDFLGMEFVDSKNYGDFKYSTGSSVNYLDPAVYNKLAEFLYPDFRLFSKTTGVTCEDERRPA